MLDGIIADNGTVKSSTIGLLRSKILQAMDMHTFSGQEKLVHCAHSIGT